jgi:hypothetical protein
MPQMPSAVAQSIARAAKDSLAAGQFGVGLRALSVDQVRQFINEYPSGHERLAQDCNLILLDAGAMLAYAPYRARVLLTDDPFENIDKICELLSVNIDALRVRIHDALLSAYSIVALGESAFDAVAPLLPQDPAVAVFPAAALRSGAGPEAPILIVNNEDERMMQQATALLADAFPQERFVPFDSSTVFDHGWKAMLQLGIARSDLPGARLSNAWAGGVPVVQLVNPLMLNALRRRRSGQLSGLIVDHGKTGLLVATIEELVATVGEFLFDALPAQAVARGAKRRVDTAAEWDAVLKSILQ